MTAEHCEVQLGRLAPLKGQPSDTYEYFGALNDIPDERFTSAVSHALKTRTWFPTPAELRIDCDAVAPHVPIEPDPPTEELSGGPRDLVLMNPCSKVTVRIPISRLWRFDCEDCADTGWFSRQCPAEYCGRKKEHAAHEYVTRCKCYDWNPTIRRHRESQAKYAQQVGK